MAHRLISRGFPRPPKQVDELRQRFNYLLLLDFEATCEQHTPIKNPEIIEFPCLALSTQDWEVKDIFHQYVKPRVNPILTPFCTELTGILQSNVDEQPHFPEIFAEFNEWLARNGFIGGKNAGAFVTCGDWDLRVMLPGQCALDKLAVPKHYESWINLKKSYCEATNYFPRSLKDMLIRSEIPLQGKLHSGLHDVLNMSSIITKLALERKAVFEITSKAGVTIKNSLK